MSSSLITTLRDEMELLLGPLVAAVDDVGAYERLLGALGADNSFASNATLLGALQAAANLRTQIDAVVNAPQPSFAGLGAVLEAISNLFVALRGLGDTTESDLARLGTDIIALLSGEYLRAQHPLLYRIGALLTLVELKEEQSSMLGVSRNGKVVRAPFPYARIRFDRLSPLVNNPGGTLGPVYLPNELATVADANHAADALFPRLGAILSELDVIWSYGLPDEDLKVLDDAAPFVDHAFQVYVPTSITGSDIDAGITFTLSSVDRGGLGLVLSPFGTLTLSTQVGRWRFDAKLGPEVQALAIGPQGATFIAGVDTSAIDASFTAALVPNTAGAPAFVFGSSTGTRLELGAAQFGATVGVSAQDASVAISAGVSSGALVIVAGDGDSFLREILPADGLRATFDLGLAYSTKGGFAFSGGAGLEATLPVSLSLAGAVALKGIHLSLKVDDGGVVAEISAIASLDIGPVHAVVDRMGILATVSFPSSGGNLGLVDLRVGFKPPSGVGLAVDVAGLTGGGFLSHDEAAAQYAGMLQLSYQLFQLQAFGLIATKLPTGPGYSLIAMIDANFPPIELVAGFTLNGVGGLLGIHRTVSIDALRAAVKAHTLSNFLFTKNPVANAAQILTDLETFFPAADGRYVFGPLLQIGWGTPTLITIDLALILELPDPVRLVLLGELAVLLPEPDEVLVELHMDVLGTIDFGTDEGSLDAVLHNSRLVGYPLHGAMALRGCWAGGDKTFLLAVGGFHPAFQPPPGFPTLDRLSISMPSGPISKLNLIGYLAVTSNTLQIGAHISMFVGVDGFGISGYLNFDALIERRPFHFEADISGGVVLSVDGHDVMSLDLAANMSGPTPWHVAGHVHFSVLWFSVTKSFSATFGDPATDQPLDQIDVGLALRTAFADPRNFTALLTTNENGLVSLRTPLTSGVVLGHPSAGLKTDQRVVPLGLGITRFGAAAPIGDTVFNITTVTIDRVAQPTTPVLQDFAPAQFVKLSDDDELSSPSFEPFAAGASLAEGALTFGRATDAATISPEITFDTWVVDTKDGHPHHLDGTTRPPDGLATIFRALADSGRRRYAAALHPVVRAPLQFIVATTDQMAPSGFGAATGQTYAQARAAMAAALSQSADRRGTLQVVARYEVP